MKPKFSIITPVWYDRDDPDNVRQPRYEMFIRCANSVRTQTFQDFEWCIGDDMCTPSVVDNVDVDKHSFNSDKQMKVVRLPEKSGRIGATNAALDLAKGEWICFLDADDEYASIYLEAIDKATKTYPDYEMFSMNHLIFNYDLSVNIREFIDLEAERIIKDKDGNIIDRYIIGDRPFGSGTIGLGAFVVKKSVLDKIERLPVCGLWNFRDWAFERYPEIKPFFWNEDNKEYNSLGNPWGNDYLLFYMLTRITKCKYLDTALYYVHSHWGHNWKDDPNYFVETKPQWNPKNQ